MRTLSLLVVLSLVSLLQLVAGQQWPSEAANSNNWTTNYGAPVSNNDESLTVGIRGPTLLEDYTLIEKLANFDRERIPERVVHAVGASAKGYFQVTADVSSHTFADFLQPQKITPVIVRFSTVIPSRGGPETVRDPRGFAVKFYTQQGNYDLVGNNFPVFFIRDGMKFPDMVHSLKPNPINNQQEWWRIWDFFSSHPESLHMFTHLLDDIGIPADFRHMDGAGVHTFKWISSAGREKLVKYTWVSNQGVKSLINDSEIQAITNPGFATLDLHNSIQAGDFPSWTLQVQLLDAADPALGFDPLDPTKIWPADVVPPITVGVLTLNETISNFFNENEQLAFSPSNIVPGIYYSDDKLLQARLFSYPDTQRYRLGGNYLLLPANAPRCPYLNHQYDGVLNFVTRTSPVNYFPSQVESQIQNSAPYPTNVAPLSGVPTRGIIPNQDDFQQPGQRFLAWDTDRQNRFIARLIDTLQPPLLVSTRKIVINYWSKVDDTILGPALRRAFP